MILLAVLSLADLALAIAAIELGTPDAPRVGLIHTSLTLIALLSIRNTQLRVDGWSRLAFPLGAIIGPCGIMVLARLRPWRTSVRQRRPTRFPIGKKQKSASATPSIVLRLLDHRTRFPDQESVESLATILRHGDLQSRCKALETAVRSFEPQLSSLVAIALADPDQTVRALAAATSAQVSANLMERVAKIEAMPPTTAAEQYDFAMFLLDHGCSNVLLSHSQRVSMRAKAKNRLIDLLRHGQLEGEQEEVVSAALVRLGMELARSAPPQIAAVNERLIAEAMA